MVLVALDGSRSVERTLAHSDPVLALRIKALGTDQARMLLESQVARQASFYTEAWAVAQILLGGGLFFFLLFATGEGKYTLLVALLMLASVLGQQVLLMPGLSMLARAGGRGAVMSGEAASVLSQGGYWVLEVGKMATGLALAVRLLLRRGSSGHARKQFNLVDEADHRSIDR
jgi:hypothetical protein